MFKLKNYANEIHIKENNNFQINCINYSDINF